MIKGTYALEFSLSYNDSNPSISIEIVCHKDIKKKTKKQEFARVKQPKVKENFNIYCNINGI